MPPAVASETGHHEVVTLLRQELGPVPAIKHKPNKGSAPDPNPDPPDPRFGPSRIRIHYSEVWIRIRIQILLSSSKNSKKNLDSYYLVTSFGLFIFEK
jgi:hypothetical protein